MINRALISSVQLYRMSSDSCKECGYHNYSAVPVSSAINYIVRELEVGGGDVVAMLRVIWEE